MRGASLAWGGGESESAAPKKRRDTLTTRRNTQPAFFLRLAARRRRAPDGDPSTVESAKALAVQRAAADFFFFFFFYLLASPQPAHQDTPSTHQDTLSPAARFTACAHTLPAADSPPAGSFSSPKASVSVYPPPWQLSVPSTPCSNTGSVYGQAYTGLKDIVPAAKLCCCPVRAAKR